MPPNAIPERDPAGYWMTGALLRVGRHLLLAPAPLPETEPLLNGTFVIRYGFRYYGKPHWAIVPGIVALDYGDMLTGEDAWEFVYKKSNLHPRADIVGYRNDGTDEMIPLKTLDLGVPVAVLAYPDAEATTATGMVTAFIGPADAETPPNLFEHLPRFDTLADWQTHES